MTQGASKWLAGFGAKVSHIDRIFIFFNQYQFTLILTILESKPESNIYMPVESQQLCGCHYIRQYKSTVRCTLVQQERSKRMKSKDITSLAETQTEIDQLQSLILKQQMS